MLMGQVIRGNLVLEVVMEHGHVGHQRPASVEVQAQLLVNRGFRFQVRVTVDVPATG